jgi:hypothetical protein
MCILCELAKSQSKNDGRLWLEQPIQRGSAPWSQFQARYEEWMRENAGISAVIDEIAIDFPDEQTLYRWMLDAVAEDGVSVFNTSVDSVAVEPFKTNYDVRYVFLEAPRLMTMRVEAMCITNGLSPLHNSLRHRVPDSENSPLVVHLSFKCQDKADYEETISRLSTSGASRVVSCVSTYGEFSYWQLPGKDSPLFLKPRVNLRDEGRGEFGMPTLGGQVTLLSGEDAIDFLRGMGVKEGED